MVTTLRQTTLRTLMPASAQRLWCACSAGACLTRAGWINPYQRTTSIFRFVREHIEKGTPSNIINTLGKHSACESFDVQIFNGDQTVVIDKPTTNFVLKVPALIHNVQVRACQKAHSLTSAIATLPASCNLALCAAQLRLRLFVVARVVYFRSIRECGERKQANVNANLFRAFRQWLCLCFSREDNEPAVSLSLDGTRLNLPFDGTREPQAHRANLSKMQLVAFQTKAALWICERIISRLGAKARIARRLLCFDATKESEKSFVESAQRILRYLRVDARNIRVSLAHIRQFNTLFRVGNRLTFKFVSVPALVQSGVVQVAAYRQRAVERNLYFLRDSQLVFIRFHALTKPYMRHLAQAETAI